MKGCKIKFLAEYEIKDATLQIASAIHDIHKLGFLHNNIQPCKILLHLNKKDGSVIAKLGGISRCQPI